MPAPAEKERLGGSDGSSQAGGVLFSSTARRSGESDSDRRCLIQLKLSDGSRRFTSSESGPKLGCAVRATARRR